MKEYKFPKHEKEWLPVVRGKYGKVQTFQVNGFLNNLLKVEASMGKHRQFLGFALPYRFRFDENSHNPISENVQIP